MPRITARDVSLQDLTAQDITAEPSTARKEAVLHEVSPNDRDCFWRCALLLDLNVDFIIFAAAQHGPLLILAKPDLSGFILSCKHCGLAGQQSYQSQEEAVLYATALTTGHGATKQASCSTAADSSAKKDNMTFLEALRTGLPMRRKSSPGSLWLVLGHEKYQGLEVPRWREISTGSAIGLHSWDYTADDWEVMANQVVQQQGKTPC